MKIPIYIDVLFVLNLFINYFIILTTARVSCNKISRIRFVISSVIGAVYATIIFFIETPFILLLLSKFIIALLMSYISFSTKNIRNLFHLGLIFLIITILFGGICLFVKLIFSPYNMAINNLTVYFNFSPVFLIFMTLIVYITISLLERFSNSTFFKDKNYTVSISHNSKICTLNGFMDNGNNLLDPFTNTPIVVCGFSNIESLFENEERIFYQNFSIENAVNSLKNVRLVMVSTVSGNAILPAFYPQSFVIHENSKKHDINNVLIAVSNESSLKNKPILLNPKLLKNRRNG